MEQAPSVQGALTLSFRSRTINRKLQSLIYALAVGMQFASDLSTSRKEPQDRSSYLPSACIDPGRELYRVLHQSSNRCRHVRHDFLSAEVDQ